MEPRRILLAALPRFTREMLRRTLEADPDLRVVGEPSDLTELPGLIDKTGAHWVIMLMPDDGAVPTELETLRQTQQAVRVMAVTTDGSHVSAWWLEPRQRVLDGLSLAELRAVLREDHPDRVSIEAGFDLASAHFNSGPPTDGG